MTLKILSNHLRHNIKRQKSANGLDFWANPDEDKIKNRKVDAVKLIRDDRDNF